MREWIEAQLATGLPALSGSQISGTLALRQDMLNELIAKWLADAQHPDKPSRIDFTKSARVVKSATVRAEPGTVLVDFQISI